jgi:hydrogenase nickel incorporation protein HypA/HybF
MHEVALAERMIRIALDAAREHGGGRVTRARLLLGALSCAEPETLRFAFDVAARGTEAEGCALEIERVPARLKCRTCGRESQGEELLEPCADCKAVGWEVLDGREMRIESIDVEDRDERTRSSTATPGDSNDPS